MSYAVGIVSCERADLTQRCVASVRANTAYPYRILMVDNGSATPGTRDLLDRCEKEPDIELTRFDANYGPARARNEIIRMAGSEYTYVAMLDNDMCVLPGWDAAAHRAFQAGADFIQPKLLHADERTVERGPNVVNPCESAANPIFVGRGCARDAAEVSEPMEVAIVGAGVFDLALLRELGGYDDALFEAEDFDLSLRAKAAGASLRYVPDCEMIHDHVMDVAYDNQRQDPRRKLHAHVAFWRKHRKALLSPRYLAWNAWLHGSGQQVYLGDSSLPFPRRLERAFWFRWYQHRLGRNWATIEQAERATERVASRLGL